MSKVDVLIPAYNAAHFLPGALESVLSQTVTDWHIQLVDDGSTDNTREVVERFLTSNADRLQGRITYHHQPNRGLPAARNSGIRNGSAPLLALLDADDLWLPDRLADCIASLEGKPETGLSYGGISRFTEPGTLLDTFTTSQPGRSRLEMATKLYTRAIHLPCPTITFRRECVEKVGFFDETMRATEDRDMWLRIAQHYDVVFVPKVLALYRTSASSMSGDLPRMLAAQLRFIEKHAGEPGCGWLARHSALAGVFEQQAQSYRERKDRASAIRFALKSLATAPWRRQGLRTLVSMMVETSK